MNIILLVLDSLREDYSQPVDKILSKYEFIKLKNVIAPAPWTLPSHASMFTGQYPILHGAHESSKLKGIKIRLRSRLQITHELKRFGFNTYLFSANDYVRPFFGFTGFDYVRMLPAAPVINVGDIDKKKLEKFKKRDKISTALNILKHREGKLFFNYFIREMSKLMLPLNKSIYGIIRNWPMNKGIISFINGIKKMKFKEPFFLFANLMEVHEPYTLFDKGDWKLLVNENIEQKIIDTWRNRYPQHVIYLSRKVDDLLSLFEAKKILEKSIVIITSDHGQLLGEYGKISHGIFLYDELLKVPMWIHLPREYDIKSIGIDNQYLSLIKTKNILINCMKNNRCDFRKYYRSVVFAESYGIPFTYKTKRENKEYVNELENYRIAVYCYGGKGIFNVKKWKFEYISLTEEEVYFAKNALIQFLKKIWI